MFTFLTNINFNMQYMYRSRKFLTKLILLINLLLIFEPIFANNFEKNKKDSEIINLRSELISPNRDFYLLGPNDVLSFEWGFDNEEFRKIYKVDQDGNLFLPRLRKVYVEGLTIKELTLLLNEEYEKAIINPQIIINLEINRPIRIYVSGEVVNQGSYEFSSTSNYTVSSLAQPIGKDFVEPTLFEAIRAAGGITPYSKLDQVSVVRKLSRLKNGEKIKTEINLISTLLDGDSSQNITLYDDDFIYIPKSEFILKDQFLQSITTNLNPSLITVFISGRVRDPSETRNIKLPRATSLNQAINVSGGIKPISGRIEFFRLNSEGIEKRVFNKAANAPIGSYKNPILQDGDIIRIRSSLLADLTEIVGEITKPAIGLFTLEALFD